MADCGATGSTIDRAARSFFGGNDAKTAVSLMGHVVGGSTQIPVPLAAPDSILLPTQSSSRAMNPIQHQQQHSQIPEHAHYAQQQQPQNQFAPRPMHMQQMAIHNQMMRQQQFQQQQQMQQMQMQAMLQQQQRQVQLQHQRQQQLLAQSVQQVMGESEEQQHQGHEGLVKGATIEDLAAAWAEAEADYEELEAAVNMAAAASAKDGDAAESEAYQFIHSAHEQDRNTARAKDWMNEGMQYFEAGDLDDAVRAFEMELQQNNPDNATAWKMLGRCHAENDQDREAIICLERAVDRDPYCLEARLALGVSYVNELNHAKALEHLKAWITHDPKYSELNIGDDMYGGGQSDNGESDFDEVQRLLLTALEFDSTDGADVLEALGVVYNVSRDFDAAIDAFQKALLRKGDDYQLYNRLGATMANCNKSEQALPAYKRAIEIKPKFTRAWLNMAISHANLHNYDEAARCYLQTLSLNPSATHCWSYLRVALSCDEHWDLIQHAASMDLDAFRQHFDFI